MDAVQITKKENQRVILEESLSSFETKTELVFAGVCDERGEPREWALIHLRALSCELP